MDGYELFKLSQAMRKTPEFQTLQELNRFSNTLTIFEKNYHELDRILWFVCDSPAGDQLFRPENRSAWEQVMAEVIRLLHNFVAAVSALVDHSRRLYGRLYKPSGAFPEYQNEVNQRFATSGLIQFVHGLRNYCLHYRTPGIGTTTTFVDLQNEKVEKRVTLSKSDLSDFEWNATAKKFLDAAPNSIDLRKTISDYHVVVKDFYNWFYQRIRALHASDYEAVSAFYSSLLSGKNKENSEKLEQRLRMFEAGIGTPFDVLHPFMTPADAADIAALMHEPDAWVAAAIERVSKYIAVESSVAQRLHAVLERLRKRSPFQSAVPENS